MNHARELQTAIVAVRRAAQLCEQVRHQLVPAALEKNDRSPVTVADFGAQAIVGQVLQTDFPLDPLIAEEDSGLLRQPEQAQTLQQIQGFIEPIVSGASPETVLDWIDHGKIPIAADHNPDRFWTLDPIDGTKGFLRGDQYAIALALVEQGQIQLGVLGCPALTLGSQSGVLLVAVRGMGTRLFPLSTPNLSFEDAPVLQVVQTTTADQFRFVESVEAAHGNQTLQETIARSVGITAPSIRMDSQAKYGTVAAGEAALYLRLPSPKTPDYREKIWDHAAGAIVIEEAGGKVTDMHGKPLDFSLGKTLAQNQGVIASNGTIHDTVLEALRQEWAIQC
jgi:3'(2'), 5'-bisphosphate nucleotidase